MYTNFYVYKALRLFMSGKLYWRIKINGKWTWRPVVPSTEFEQRVIDRMYTGSTYFVGEEE